MPDLLNNLVHHWPEPLHLVLISRVNPELPLPSLRARGMLNEIRTHDRRFTPEECAIFLRQASNAYATESLLNLVQERFEGWPAGLHLARLSMRAAGSEEARLGTLSRNDPNIRGYLVEEVLAHQFPAIRSFLLKTSILDRFCSSLCEAVIGESDAAWDVRACLDWIEHSQLFIIPLDDHGEWYRYHHMFQESLQQRLTAETTPDQVAHLHRLASAWFEKQGLIGEALHHALATGDHELAARQMSIGLRDVLNRTDRASLERWLRLLPEEMIQQRPDLLMLRVWELQFQWRLDRQLQVLAQIEELLKAGGGDALPAEQMENLHGQMLIQRSQLAYFLNQNGQGIDLARQAWAILPPSWRFGRGGALFYLGLNMQGAGQASEAERLLLDEFESSPDKTDMYPLLAVESLGLIYLNAGQLEEARQIGQLLLQEATRGQLFIMMNWGDHYLGVVHYHWNELETAAEHFSQIAAQPYLAQKTTFRDAIAALVLIHQIKGESAEAWRLVESISRLDLEEQGHEDDRTRSLRAGLMLMQGDLEGAGRWADAFTDLPPDMLLIWLEEPQVTRAHVLIARGSEADLSLALQVLGVLADIADRTHNTRFKIQILAMRALALDAQGKTGLAVDELMRALELARPGGFIRVFVDLGQPMQAMLRRLVDQASSVESIRPILAAFPEAAISPVRKRSLAFSNLAEPLTHRELEILTLMREPLALKEIAPQLHITYATVKRHSSNLYGKLGVNGRWQAVTRAEELDILLPR